MLLRERPVLQRQGLRAQVINDVDGLQGFGKTLPETIYRFTGHTSE
jgi:hypothetical protein